jgi:type IV secretory pathway VirB2 component (pilin)
METAGSILGLALLFGPPGWQPINRGITIVLGIVLIFAGVSGVTILVLIAKAQAQPPYIDRPTL